MTTEKKSDTKSVNERFDAEWRASMTQRMGSIEAELEMLMESYGSILESVRVLRESLEEIETSLKGLTEP